MLPISPHFGGGSGLKHIETSEVSRPGGDLPSLRWGERIETQAAMSIKSSCFCISPHFGGGSGLKRVLGLQELCCLEISPLTSVGGAD